jgi:carbamate kinase
VRVVVALGGNALLRRGEPADLTTQRHNVADAAVAIAALATEHEIVITHGNGPQVGRLALQSEALAPGAPDSLDVLGAESEGLIGYLIEQELRGRLPGREVVALLTQVEVDAADPAFQRPSKPIGPVYTRAEAERLAGERGWRIVPDGEHFRRVVPSPEPRRILELAAIRLLVERGMIAICVGGGGIPVVRAPGEELRGVEAVIDKDLAAALLARDLDADALLLLTDVDAVYEDWGTPDAQPIFESSPDRLRKLHLDPGSMGPKVEAACRFAEAGGRSGIGSLGNAAAILEGWSGTSVRA